MIIDTKKLKDLIKANRLIHSENLLVLNKILILERSLDLVERIAEKTEIIEAN